MSEAAAVEGRGVIGPQPQRFVAIGQGLLQLPVGNHIGEAAAIVRRGKSWIERDGVVQVVDGMIEVTLFEVSGGQIIPGGSVIASSLMI